MNLLVPVTAIPLNVAKPSDLTSEVLDSSLGYLLDILDSQRSPIKRRFWSLQAPVMRSLDEFILFYFCFSSIILISYMLKPLLLNLIKVRCLLVTRLKQGYFIMTLVASEAETWKGYNDNNNNKKSLSKTFLGESRIALCRKFKR